MTNLKRNRKRSRKRSRRKLRKRSRKRSRRKLRKRSRKRSRVFRTKVKNLRSDLSKLRRESYDRQYNTMLPPKSVLLTPEQKQAIREATVRQRQKIRRRKLMKKLNRHKRLYPNGIAGHHPVLIIK